MVRRSLGTGSARAGPGTGGLTPSDVPLVSVSQRDIESWEDRYPGVVDVWPLTAMQSGLLFHSMLAGSAFDAYTTQLVLHLGGRVDPGRILAAGQALLDRHANLRTAFVDDSESGPVQVVLGAVALPWREVDLRNLPEALETASSNVFSSRIRPHISTRRRRR